MLRVRHDRYIHALLDVVHGAVPWRSMVEESKLALMEEMFWIRKVKTLNSRSQASIG
jgi:hypothetical protein